MASSQKYMTYIMPFFALTGLYWPFGLVLYWCTTNIWTLGQQYILGRRYPYTPPAPVDGDAPAKPAGRTATANALSSGGGRAQRSNGRAAGGGRGAANGSSAASSPGSNGSMLRRLTKGKPEPEPEPAAPGVKVVRHQQQRQSRSKRSGKR